MTIIFKVTEETIQYRARDFIKRDLTKEELETVCKIVHYTLSFQSRAVIEDALVFVEKERIKT